MDVLRDFREGPVLLVQHCFATGGESANFQKVVGTTGFLVLEPKSKTKTLVIYEYIIIYMMCHLRYFYNTSFFSRERERTPNLLHGFFTMKFEPIKLLSSSMRTKSHSKPLNSHKARPKHACPNPEKHQTRLEHLFFQGVQQQNRSATWFKASCWPKTQVKFKGLSSSTTTHPWIQHQLPCIV